MGRVLDWLESAPGCSLCDQPSDGYWVGASTVFCCRQCAIEILPKLICDSALIGLASESDYERAANLYAEIRGPFWEAVAARLLRLNRSNRELRVVARGRDA